MSRREQILDELGLGPLWLERAHWLSLSATDFVPAPLTDGPVSAPAPAPVAHAPHPAVHVPAADTAPVIATHAIPALEAVEKPARKAPIVPVVETRAERPDAEVIAPDTRALEIAQMDWATLQATMQGCVACGLSASRTQVVPGVGNPQAHIMVIGEAPGQEEDLRGEPFVGAAGKLLDNMLKAIGEARGERVYIANVLKCRPPGNRNPQVDEVAQCAPFLQRQVALVQPKVIFAVGRFAIQMLLNTDAPVSALRGKVHQYQGIPVVVSYHPAYLLRNLPDKAKAWRDLLLLKATLS
ncbi:uracil-DNA glycosylase [Amantichitinum ursilacus]|uniref:Type-4 uracil-DNA glycosylase n=1 Tax=Amantichitinum ursilacus TaxID=857265 RepID=A0A0N0GQY8_9NEIS|nr:uracil-DNA glycosylase [Amantichitinum ursilacus]KPC55168.1 Uracil DNA glycosylase superfamily protein [Amantichitinum ursilacus]